MPTPLPSCACPVPPSSHSVRHSHGLLRVRPAALRPRPPGHSGPQTGSRHGRARAPHALICSLRLSCRPARPAVIRLKHFYHCSFGPCRDVNASIYPRYRACITPHAGCGSPPPAFPRSAPGRGPRARSPRRPWPCACPGMSGRSARYAAAGVPRSSRGAVTECRAESLKWAGVRMRSRIVLAPSWSVSARAMANACHKYVN